LNFANSFKSGHPVSDKKLTSTPRLKHFSIANVLAKMPARWCEGEVEVHDTINGMASPHNPGSLLWPHRSLPVEISYEEVHIWAWSFGSTTELTAAEPADSDLESLDEQERRRTARFYFAPDRVRYSACHASMRRILGSYLERSPGSLVYREAEGGKPELVLESGQPPLRFNLSHSKSVALLAVSLQAEVGVDVEDIRPIERAVAERFFSPAEVAALAPLDGEEWLNAFYRCWTRKEAILKVEGMGLRTPLDSFDVSLLPDEPAALLATRPESKLTANWHLHHLAPAAGSMAALAVATSSAEITTFSFVREAADESMSAKPMEGWPESLGSVVKDRHALPDLEKTVTQRNPDITEALVD
jgi:4'-phosphopantetheinyl transferase